MSKSYDRMMQTHADARALMARGFDAGSTVTTEDVAAAWDVAADAAEENGNKHAAEECRGTALLWRTKAKGGNYNPNNVNEV